MSEYLEDRQAIADLMTGWMRRDLAQWEGLRQLFHDDGVIEISHAPPAEAELEAAFEWSLGRYPKTYTDLAK